MYTKIISVCFIIVMLSCQSSDITGPAAELKKHALPISNLSKLDADIYKEIEKYDVILMGEMHGTKEPSEFVYGLSKLIADKEGKVTLALEIPSSQLEDLTDEMTKEELMGLPFFEGENSTGQNATAILDLIHLANQDSRIDLKFMDNLRGSTRDSSMYAEIADMKKTGPFTKIVTLTGNIHNWLIPFSNEERIGGYLVKDTINFIPERIMSIDHYYNQGTMLNNMGNGLELTTIEPRDNIFNQTISDKMFLCKMIFDDKEQNTHFLFTDSVTHSPPVQQ